MIDIDKLIGRLYTKQLSYASYTNSELAHVLEDASTALSELHAENEKLRAELEKVKAERDAAIKDLNEFLSMDELCPTQCEWCKWNGTYCDGKTPEWRGIKKED